MPREGTSRNSYSYYFREGYTPRPQQQEALDWLDIRMGIGHKCKVIEGPTGVGKSLIADAIAKREADRGMKTSIVTATNSLLDQYIREFPEYPFLKGAAHYPCLGFTDNNCAQTRIIERAINSGKPLCNLPCPYRTAREECLESRYAIFNTMSFYYAPNLKRDEFTGKCHYLNDILIIDEFQEVASLLTAQYELTLWEDEIKIPPGISASILAVVGLLQKRANALTQLFQLNYTKMSPKEVGKLTDQIDRLFRIVETLSKNPEEFVVEELDSYRYGKKLRCLKIRAIRPQPRQLKTLFAVKKVVLMSATALDIDVKELGFEKYDKLNLSSPIPVSNRKIYAESIVANTYKNKEVAPAIIAKRIKEIVADRPRERGVVLTTYRQMEALKEFLKEDFYLFHDKKTRQETIQWFIENPDKYCVGVFAASFAGLDLKDDIARFVILPNVPLPSFMDAVVQKRIELDKHATPPQNWYEMQAMIDLIQGSGRASRSEKDYSTIHILDTQFIRIFARTNKQLPEVFK